MLAGLALHAHTSGGLCLSLSPCAVRTTCLLNGSLVAGLLCLLPPGLRCAGFFVCTRLCRQGADLHVIMMRRLLLALLTPLLTPIPPCSEIILRPYQFCNLTEVVVRDSDDAASLARKARLAAILGTFQASLVDFPYLRDIWRHNTAEVRLRIDMSTQAHEP